MQIICIEGQCLKDYPVETVIYESFVKIYDENNDKGYIFEVDVEYQKNFLIFIVIYHFYMKERKLKKPKGLFVIYITKKAMLYT